MVSARNDVIDLRHGADERWIIRPGRLQDCLRPRAVSGCGEVGIGDAREGAIASKDEVFVTAVLVAMRGGFNSIGTLE